MSPTTTRNSSSGPPSYHSSIPSAIPSTTTHLRNLQDQQPKIVGSIPANAPSRPPSCSPPSYAHDHQPPNYYQVALDDRMITHHLGIPSYFQPRIPPGYHPAPPHLQQQVQQTHSFNTPQPPPHLHPSPPSLERQPAASIPPQTTYLPLQAQHEQAPNMTQPVFFVASPYNYPHTLTATAMINSAYTQSLVLPRPSAAGYQYVAYGQYYYPGQAAYYYAPAYQVPISWLPQYWYHA